MAALGPAWNWEAVGTIPRPRYRIVAVERRVYGRSGPPQSPHSMAREAEDIAAVLAQVGEPALLVGQSSGRWYRSRRAAASRRTSPASCSMSRRCSSTRRWAATARPRAEAALARGDQDEALRIFFRETVEVPEQAVEFIEIACARLRRKGWASDEAAGRPIRMRTRAPCRALPMQDGPLSGDRSCGSLLLRGSESHSRLHRPARCTEGC